MMRTVIVALGGNAFLKKGQKGTFEKIRENRNLKISEIEKLVGHGDSQKGAGKIKKLLKEFANVSLSPATIAKLLDKDRHIIPNWYRRYNIKYIGGKGDKPRLLKVTLSENKNNIKLPILEKINGKLYKVYYLYPNDLFAYFLGVILGDGSSDSRKIYITGGSHEKKFLNILYKKAQKLSKYLGNVSIKIRYFNDTQGINDRDISFWRLYVYCSALAHSLKNKNILKEILEKIWSLPNLFNSFTAGLLDTDGYFVYRKNKPERIELGQTIDKWWFPLFLRKLEQKFLIKRFIRNREYEIKNRGKVYKGVSKTLIINWYMSSWPKFIDNVLPLCLNPHRVEDAFIFKQHALDMQNRLRIK